MGYIALTKINWGTNAPSATTQCTVKYRLASADDVDASYTTRSTTTMIEVDGDIVAAPLNITGLADETAYVVKINANCGGASAQEEFITGAICPDVVGIVGTGNAGNP